MRPSIAFFLLATLCSALFASTVTIRVLDNWNTALYGTPVELLQDSVVVANATADRTGYAAMEVQDDEYIARVSRAGYPVFVSVVNVQGKTDITLTALQGRSYSVIYGTVYVEGDDIPQGLKLYAVRNGITQSSARVYPDGAYVLQFLDDGQYELVAGGEEYSGSKINFSVSGYETRLIDVHLKKKGAAENGSGIAPVETALPFVAIVDRGALYAPIKIRVGSGDTLAANAQVQALTPDGEISLVADESGLVILNAAREGRYVFSYGGVQAVVEIGVKKESTAASDAYAQQLAQEEEALAAAVAAGKAAQQKQANANVAILFGIGTFALLAVVILVGAYFFMKGKRGSREHSHAGMHAHKDAHEGHVHAQGHEAGHIGEIGMGSHKQSPLEGKKHARHAKK